MNLYQDLLFRSLDLARGRRTIDRLHFLRRSQYWSRQQLAEWQLARLNALLLQAREHSPFHRERLAAIALPLTSLDQLAAIPRLTKQQIRDHGAAIRAGNLPPSRFVPSRTGGSTGEPMQYFWDKRGMDWNRASVYRSAEWAGTALGERTALMSGSHFDYTQSQRLMTRAMLLIQRYRDFPVADSTDELMARYCDALQRFRPTAIWGYASGIDTFARYVERERPDADFGFLKALVTSSETLRLSQRQAIERVFGTGKVYDNYGSREMYLGAECHCHDGYHLHAEVVLVEVVDHDDQPCPPGTRGRILVTDLSNHAFPFIRYEIGDVGVLAPPSSCGCAVALPRLHALEGRISDLIVLRDRVLTPPNFATLFSDLPGIAAYQVRQPAIDRIDIEIIPGDDYRVTTGEYIHRSVVSMAGGSATVGYRLVSEIRVPESGKRRFVLSDVAADQL